MIFSLPESRRPRVPADGRQREYAEAPGSRHWRAKALASNGGLLASLRTGAPGQVRTFKVREIRGANDRSQSTADVDRNPSAATKTPKRSFDDSQQMVASEL